MIREINFDGLVGPTHNYGGLSYGNIASTKNKLSDSSPRRAALQGLEKMKYLMDKGILQGVLPPQERPALDTFRNLGFSGTDQALLKTVYLQDPTFFFFFFFDSHFWDVIAANVSPSRYSSDFKVHITPANLISNFHRSLEVSSTTKVLRKIFQNAIYFTVHDPLPSISIFSDEGAANFCRITKEHGKKGFELFVHGRDNMHSDLRKFPARQTLEANNILIRRHQLNPKFCFNLKQNSNVINQGVFHNDVISVANENVFFYHENAFEAKGDFALLQLRIAAAIDSRIFYLKVSNNDLSVKDAVATYLFNSQLITVSKGKMLLLAPLECKTSKKVQKVIQKILNADNPLQEVQYLNLRESMRNGGGPACLRLRIVLTAKELSALSGNVILTPSLYRDLVTWVNYYYSDHLSPKDLTNYHLFKKNRLALEELTHILGLGKIYHFQTVEEKS